ncbi:MAG: T9SS type A sorting domain-containing protein, partial [Cyclobacteriaceae bacterium]|nr:T9SS type A sorting domain-containing protein [Cyclobacteriaceae bacterium]
SWNDTRVGNESTIGKVKVFDGASYSDGNVLEAYQGGFVFVQGAAPISVKVRFNGITTGGRIATEETSLDLSKPNWALPLTVKSNEIANSIGGIGMNEKAKMGWDQYDDRNPPRFLDYAELSFRKTNTDVTDLARDIISTQDEYIWEFSVLAEGNTNLTWAHELISGDKDLLLFDLTSQRVIDMKATGTYLLNPKEGNNFRIYFGNNLHDLIKPTAIVLGKAFPNPAQNETNIAFTLPESQSTYQVQLEVYNSVGQREAILANGTFYEGFYSTNWNTENNNNGLYFYRLTVSTNGIKKTLTEKIIINR